MKTLSRTTRWISCCGILMIPLLTGCITEEEAKKRTQSAYSQGRQSAEQEAQQEIARIQAQAAHDIAAAKSAGQNQARTEAYDERTKLREAHQQEIERLRQEFAEQLATQKKELEASNSKSVAMAKELGDLEGYLRGIKDAKEVSQAEEAELEEKLAAIHELELQQARVETAEETRRTTKLEAFAQGNAVLLVLIALGVLVIFVSLSALYLRHSRQARHNDLDSVLRENPDALARLIEHFRDNQDTPRLIEG